MTCHEAGSGFRLRRDSSASTGAAGNPCSSREHPTRRSFASVTHLRSHAADARHLHLEREHMFTKYPISLGARHAAPVVQRADDHLILPRMAAEQQSVPDFCHELHSVVQSDVSVLPEEGPRPVALHESCSTRTFALSRYCSRPTVSSANLIV